MELTYLNSVQYLITVIRRTGVGAARQTDGKAKREGRPRAAEAAPAVLLRRESAAPDRVNIDHQGDTLCYCASSCSVLYRNFPSADNSKWQCKMTAAVVSLLHY